MRSANLWDTLSDADRVKGHVDAALNILAAIDRRAAQVEARPTAIAAEQSGLAMVAPRDGT
jgi:hypothetical protein